MNNPIIRATKDIIYTLQRVPLKTTPNNLVMKYHDSISKPLQKPHSDLVVVTTNSRK